MTVETRVVLPVADRRTTWRTVGAAMRQRRVVAAAAFGSFAVSNAFGLLAPWILGRLVDETIDGASTSAALVAAGGLVLAALGSGVFLMIGVATMARLGESTLAHLRERVVGNALRLPTADLDRAGSGDLLTRVGDDVATVTQAINNTIPMVVGSGFATGLTAIAMFGLDWRLGLAGLLCAPLYAIGIRTYLPRAVPLYAQERLAVGERAQSLVGSLHGAHTVRAYQVEDAAVRDVAQHSHAAMLLGVRTFRALTTFTGWMNRGELVGLAALLGVGFLLVDNGVGTVGEATTAALLFHRLFGPLGTLMVTFDDVQAAGAGLARLVGVIEMPMPDSPADRPPFADAGIVVDRVSHRYADGPAVLDEVSLEIEPGERLALVGASGAGKTTLASVIAGRLAATDGEVRIGGVPTEKLGEAGCRQCAGMVSQDVHIFHGELRDDLGLAASAATDEELYAALTGVGARPWVDALPDGLSTVVGENAHRLTAAQAQQVALARLMLADPPIVVLDEATAEAGSAGAAVLERATDVVVAGRTSVVVAHRLTQAVAADRVAVMERGRIVELGAPEELIERGGRFARLWTAWRGDSDDEKGTADRGVGSGAGGRSG